MQGEPDYSREMYHPPPTRIREGPRPYRGFECSDDVTAVENSIITFPRKAL